MTYLPAMPHHADKAPLVFSVTSGKGGVGKTNVSVNLAYSLAKEGNKVVLLDADLGLANVDILLGVNPSKNIFHLVHEGAALKDVLFETPFGFSILPAASGVAEMMGLDTGQKLTLLEAMEELDTDLDYLIVDTGAGISDTVRYFNIAVQERIVVLTPEPTSLTDAYALIKVLKTEHGVERYRVLVNQTRDMKAAKEVFLRLSKACDHFLDGVSLDLMGFIPHDKAMRRAVMDQAPLCHGQAKSPAGQALASMAHQVAEWERADNVDGNIKFFWKRLLFHA